MTATSPHYDYTQRTFYVTVGFDLERLASMDEEAATRTVELELGIVGSQALVLANVKRKVQQETR